MSVSCECVRVYVCVSLDVRTTLSELTTSGGLLVFPTSISSSSVTLPLVEGVLYPHKFLRGFYSILEGTVVFLGPDPFPPSGPSLVHRGG